MRPLIVPHIVSMLIKSPDERVGDDLVVHGPLPAVVREVTHPPAIAATPLTGGRLGVGGGYDHLAWGGGPSVVKKYFCVKLKYFIIIINVSY